MQTREVIYSVETVSVSTRDVAKLVAVRLRSMGNDGIGFPALLDIELPKDEQPMVGTRVALMVVDQSVSELADGDCPYCHRATGMVHK